MFDGWKTPSQFGVSRTSSPIRIADQAFTKELVRGGLVRLLYRPTLLQDLYVCRSTSFHPGCPAISPALINDYTDNQRFGRTKCEVWSWISECHADAQTTQDRGTRTRKHTQSIHTISWISERLTRWGKNWHAGPNAFPWLHVERSTMNPSVSLARSPWGLGPLLQRDVLPSRHCSFGRLMGLWDASVLLSITWLQDHLCLVKIGSSRASGSRSAVFEYSRTISLNREQLSSTPTLEGKLFERERSKVKAQRLEEKISERRQTLACTLKKFHDLGPTGHYRHQRRLVSVRHAHPNHGW